MQTYKGDPKLGKTSNFKTSISLSIVFSNLGFGMPDQAIQNIKDIRQGICGGFYDNSDQQDAQEFLQSLVNTVKEELDEIQGDKPYIVEREIFGDRALQMEVSALIFFTVKKGVFLTFCLPFFVYADVYLEFNKSKV